MVVSYPVDLLYFFLRNLNVVLGFRFPIREYGMNYASQPLQLHEIDSMKADSHIIDRILASYQLMLDFYGMQLLSSDTGLLVRSLPPKNHAPRYRNLVRELNGCFEPVLFYFIIIIDLCSSRLLSQQLANHSNLEMPIRAGIRTPHRGLFITCSQRTERVRSTEFIWHKRQHGHMVG